MGPPLFSGGNIGRCKGAVVQPSRFNGAAAVQRRKSRRRSAAQASRWGLQWGRRCSAAEISRPSRRGRLGRASMGPPLFSGGNNQPNNGGNDKLVASMGPPLFSGGNG